MRKPLNLMAGRLAVPEPRNGRSLMLDVDASCPRVLGSSDGERDADSLADLLGGPKRHPCRESSVPLARLACAVGSVLVERDGPDGSDERLVERGATHDADAVDPLRRDGRQRPEEPTFTLTPDRDRQGTGRRVVTPPYQTSLREIPRHASADLWLGAEIDRADQPRAPHGPRRRATRSVSTSVMHQVQFVRPHTSQRKPNRSSREYHHEPKWQSTGAQSRIPPMVVAKYEREPVRSGGSISAAKRCWSRRDGGGVVPVDVIRTPIPSHHGSPAA
jgi:hypothetical protein